MTQTQDDNFDDPGLKAAIRRVWGNETAPIAMRHRFEAARAQASAPRRLIPGAWAIRRPLFGFAAAALVFMAVGLVLHPWQHPPTTHQTNPQTASLIVPASLASDLVSCHEQCSSAPDHHGIASNDFAEIRRELSKRLGFPVLCDPLPGAGWQFHGASVCKVGKTPCGHLVFEHNGQRYVSLFSLPPDVIHPAAERGAASQITEHHPLAAFTTPEGFYCVVGSSPDGSVTLDQVRSMLDRLEGDLAANDDAANQALTDSR